MELAREQGKELRRWYKARDTQKKKDTHTTTSGRKIKLRDIYHTLNPEEEESEDEGTLLTVDTTVNTTEQRLRAENALLQQQIKEIRDKRQDLIQEHLDTPIDQPLHTVGNLITQLRFFEQRPEVLQDHHPKHLQSFLRKVRDFAEDWEQPEQVPSDLAFETDDSFRNVLWIAKRVQGEKVPGRRLAFANAFTKDLVPWLESGLEDDDTQFHTGNPTPIPRTPEQASSDVEDIEVERRSPEIVNAPEEPEALDEGSDSEQLIRLPSGRLSTITAIQQDQTLAEVSEEELVLGERRRLERLQNEEADDRKRQLEKKKQLWKQGRSHLRQLAPEPAEEEDQPDAPEGSLKALP